jgi:hypothetical protein
MARACRQYPAKSGASLRNREMVLFFAAMPQKTAPFLSWRGAAAQIAAAKGDCKVALPAIVREAPTQRKWRILQVKRSRSWVLTNYAKNTLSIA